ncbi:MAG: hypothetical protein Q8R00_03200 [Candidatus Nanoarchaeia archaeon]|nr:hypothetical protein [Candidatus Nanoarchaeia archaeon]
MINILFAVVYLAFLVLARMKIHSNMLKLGTLSPALQQLGALLEQSPEALPQLQQTLDQIGALNNQTLILFWAIPIMTIVLWSVFQGFSWSLLTNKLNNLKLYFTRFFIVSFIALGLLFMVGYYTISSITSVFEIKLMPFLGYLVFSFLIFYYLFVFYGFTIRNDTLKNTLKRAFNISVRKAKFLVPLFIPMFILLMTTIFIFFNIYTNKIIGTFSLMNVLPWTVALLILVSALIWYKLFLVVYLERH